MIFKCRIFKKTFHNLLNSYRVTSENVRKYIEVRKCRKIPMLQMYANFEKKSEFWKFQNLIRRSIFGHFCPFEIIVWHFHPLLSYKGLISESKTPYILRAKVEKIRAQMCFVPMQIAAI